MRALWILASLLLLSGCVTFYRSYNYSIDRYPDDIWGVHVYFWGEGDGPDWKDKARAAALKMMDHELEAHGLPRERIVITEMVPMEGSGIFVYGFAGTASVLDSWTPARLEGLIDPRSRPYREPYAHGSGKLPPQNQPGMAPSSATGRGSP